MFGSSSFTPLLVKCYNAKNNLIYKNLSELVLLPSSQSNTRSLCTKGTFSFIIFYHLSKIFGSIYKSNPFLELSYTSYIPHISYKTVYCTSERLMVCCRPDYYDYHNVILLQQYHCSNQMLIHLDMLCFLWNKVIGSLDNIKYIVCVIYQR